jgi:hypothetical protein
MQQRPNEMKEQTEAFFAEVREAFHFLEQQYGYERVEESIEHPNEWRDAIAQSRYVGARVGVRIWWYFAASAIGVFFIELLQVGVSPEEWSLFRPANPDVARAIHLYDLAGIRNRHDDPDFILGDVEERRKLKKRTRQIESQRGEIVAGLARATHSYAKDILQGDTSIFPAVIDYHLEKFKRQHPSMRIPSS